jgi:hypothetical protein
MVKISPAKISINAGFIAPCRGRRAVRPSNYSGISGLSTWFPYALSIPFSAAMLRRKQFESHRTKVAVKEGKDEGF